MNPLEGKMVITYLCKRRESTMKDATYKSGLRLVLYFVVWPRRLVLYFVAWCRSDVVNLVLGFLLLRFFSVLMNTFKEFTFYDFLSHKTVAFVQSLCNNWVSSGMK